MCGPYCARPLTAVATVETRTLFWAAIGRRQSTHRRPVRIGQTGKAQSPTPPGRSRRALRQPWAALSYGPQVTSLRPPARPDGYWRLRWMEEGHRRDTTARSRDEAVAKAAELVAGLARSRPTDWARAMTTPDHCRRAAIRCRRSAPLAPRGWRADRDAARFGARIGASCVVSCWATMGAVVALGHHAVVMVAGLALHLHRRVRAA